MQLDRRGFLTSAAAAVAGGAVWLGPGPAAALTSDEAAEFVQETLNELAAMLKADSSGAQKAAQLRSIMEQRGAMLEIARFVAGPVWRGMSESQRSRFVEAFTGYVSGIYARRFEEYSGKAGEAELFRMGRVRDAGKKGMLVQTDIVREGESPVAVEWLVTDQPGRTVIADIVIEGISLLVTQREEIGSMLDARNGDVDKLIEHLAAA